MSSKLLRTEDVVFARAGERINAYAAWLRSDERLPAVIIVPDVRGLSEHYRDVARRLAEERIFALAIDLYSREGAPELPDMDSVRRWIDQLDDRRVLADIDAAVRFLGSRAEVRQRAIGITGFCMGGQYALLAACTIPNLAACVAFYAMLRYAQKTEWKPRDPLDVADQLGCPYLGLFGEEDALIPRADIRELEGTLRRTGKTFQTRVYAGAGHAFFNDTRPDVFRPLAAKDAWNRTVKFFRTHLLSR